MSALIPVRRRGNWVADTTYLAGDVVIYNGTTYVCSAQSNDPSFNLSNFTPYNSKVSSSLLLATGPTGPTGEPGEPGPTGPTGPQGPAGQRGAQGLTGGTGPQGPGGPAGANGATGPAGPTGGQGVQGQKGETGPQGQTGARGATGDQGVAGETGVQGPRGFAGAQGVPGPAGQPGSPGEPGVPGQPGATGERGASGPRGLQGDAGPAGVQGNPGPKGDQGETGPQGPAGEGSSDAESIQGTRVTEDQVFQGDVLRAFTDDETGEEYWAPVPFGVLLNGQDGSQLNVDYVGDVGGDVTATLRDVLSELYARPSGGGGSGDATSILGVPVTPITPDDVYGLLSLAYDPDADALKWEPVSRTAFLEYARGDNLVVGYTDANGNQYNNLLTSIVQELRERPSGGGGSGDATSIQGFPVTTPVPTDAYGLLSLVIDYESPTPDSFKWEPVSRAEFLEYADLSSGLVKYEATGGGIYGNLLSSVIKELRERPAIQPLEWIVPTLGNDWVSYNTSTGGSNFAEFAMALDAFGIVHMRGLVRNVTQNNPYVVNPGGIPVQFRPTRETIILGYGSAGPQQIRILADGSLRFDPMPTGVVSYPYSSFDGITYPVKAA